MVKILMLLLCGKTTGASRFTISLSPEIVEYGQTYDLSKVINKEYKQIDFVKRSCSCL